MEIFFRMALRKSLYCDNWFIEKPSYKLKTFESIERSPILFCQQTFPPDLNFVLELLLANHQILYTLSKQQTKEATETYFWNICSEGVPSWKLTICSMIFKKGFLENLYLFGNINSTPGKSVSVRKPKKIVLLENRQPKKLLLENRYLFDE